MQRMPSSLRSKIQSGSLKRASVRTAFMASAAFGAGAGREQRALVVAQRCERVAHASSPSSASLARDLLDRPAALDRLGLRALRVAPGVGALVAALDQQPLRLAAAVRPLERPPALELLAVEPDLRVPGVERLGHRALLVEVAVRAGVPHDHGARPVALADHALEVGVLERVVLDLDREALHARVGRRPLRDGPRAQRPVDLEAEVVVQARGVVLLDDEARRAAAARAGASGAPSPRTPGSGVLSGSRLRR